MRAGPTCTVFLHVLNLRRPLGFFSSEKAAFEGCLREDIATATRLSVLTIVISALSPSSVTVQFFEQGQSASGILQNQLDDERSELRTGACSR